MPNFLAQKNLLLNDQHPPQAKKMKKANRNPPNIPITTIFKQRNIHGNIPPSPNLTKSTSRINTKNPQKILNTRIKTPRP